MVAKRKKADEPEKHVVATAEGIGTHYEVVTDYADPVRYAVTLTAGPVNHTVKEGMTWMEAMGYIAAEVHKELVDNYGAE